MQLGLEYVQQGDMNAARQNLEKALAAAPQDYRTQLGMALYEQQIDENALAEQRYQHILKLANGMCRIITVRFFAVWGSM